MENRFPQHSYPDDVQIVRHGEKTILLIGTAHISRQSVELVEQVIAREELDCVCVELDKNRYEALSNPRRWENLDLKQIIRNKQLSTLLVNLVLASYQKKLGGRLGVMPGAELLAAAKAAVRRDIDVELCDRDVRATLRRAWRSTSLWKKGYLLATILASLFDKTEIDEEKLKELKDKDVLSELMEDLGEALPDVKHVLIDERDIYLAEKIKAAPGKRVAAVVGAGHVVGIRRVISEDNAHRLAEISRIPPVSKIWKAVGWGIPAIILLSLLLIGIQKGGQAAGANALYWILANGIPSGIGALIAWAHPATVLSAFAGAPITSLTPVIGAGYVAAFVQVMTRPPVVREFEAVTDDMGTFSGWWKNKLLRVFLVFLLTGLGSTLGTYIGGYRIIANLIS